LDQTRVLIERVWHKWLARRSQRRMTWKRFQAIKQRFALPRATIVHRYVHA
jgi:hypothetical protein